MSKGYLTRKPTTIRQLTYVSSPYLHEDPDVVEQRLVETQVAVNHLREHPEIVPYSPILDTLGSETPDGEEFVPAAAWYTYDLTILSKADILIVLQLDGWNDSVGVYTELMAALSLEIPIYYCTLDEIIDGESDTVCVGRGTSA